MGFYYGSLVFICLFMLLILPVTGRLIFRLLKRQEKKRWWIYIGILLPVLMITFYSNAFPLFRDLPYALRQETETTEGVVETVFFPGGSIGFVLEGNEYRRNPWQFKPEEGKRYRLEYLPNSRYVINYLVID